MLKKMLFAFVVAMCAMTLHAQVTEVTKEMSYGNRPGYRILIKDADVKEATKLWEDHIRKNFGAKTKKGKGGELVSTEASGGVLGSTKGTIYSTVEKEGNDVVIHAWFDNGTTFVTSNSSTTAGAAATASLGAFQMSARRNTLANEVAAEEKTLSKQTDNMDKLKKENETLLKSIESYKQKIADAENAITENQRAQETLLTDMTNQQKKVDDARVRLKNVENEQ